MTPKAMDAAIIAAAQKVEHYEIPGNGTARAYAMELNLNYVAALLEETLEEEYEADDLLTDLAVQQVNIDAENADDEEEDKDENDDITPGPWLEKGLTVIQKNPLIFYILSIKTRNNKYENGSRH